MSDIDISITFTSRGRPVDLVEALHGLWALADEPERLAAVVAVDPDDEATQAVENVLPSRCRLWVAPERYGYNGLHLYLNQITRPSMVQGKWLMWFNDDMRMQTRGWDTVIRNSPPGVLWPRANHVGHANVCPIWPAAWTHATGYVSANMHLDTWLQWAAEALGCHYPVDIEIVHDRADVTGNHDDATYREGRFLLGPEGMVPEFQATMAAFPSWVETVRKVMSES